MRYFDIIVADKNSKRYAIFKNNEDLHKKSLEFRELGKPFSGFGKKIFFQQSESGEISDFLDTNMGFLIVSERIYGALRENYSSEIEFFPCAVEYHSEILTYYILRAKQCLDAVDKEHSIMIKSGEYEFPFRTVIDDTKVVSNNNFFGLINGPENVISEKLAKDLMDLKPTNFSLNEFDTKTFIEKKLTNQIK